ncbi:MAG: hypothetical protein ACI4UE_01490 [Candidatus Scatovivens sp.]
MNKKRLILIFIIILLSIFLTGCKNNESPEKITEKTSKELGYFEEKIFQIILKLEKDDYLSPDNTLDWKKILEDAEKINMELDNIMLDLSNLNLANEKIDDISVYTNNILMAISEKNETKLMSELNNLYQTIPKYLEIYEEDKNTIMKKELKAFVLSSFNYAINGDWGSAKNEVINAENKYNEMIGNNSYIEENSYNINKVYILIQEYKTSVNSENFELCRLKFISLCSEI